MKVNTILTSLAGLILASLAITGVPSWSASRADIQAAAQADARRSARATLSRDQQIESIRGINRSTSNYGSGTGLSEQQQQLLEQRRREIEQRRQQLEAQRGGRSATGEATGRRPAPVRPPGGGTTSTGNKPRGTSGNIDVSGGQGTVDAGLLTLSLSHSYPEEATGLVDLAVRLNNSKSISLDLVNFTLKYDPDFLEFLPPASATRAAELGTVYYIEDEGGDFSLALSHKLPEGYVNYVEPEVGVVRYRAHTPTPDAIAGKGTLAMLRFRFKQKVGSTNIEFIFRKDELPFIELAELDAAHLVRSETDTGYWTEVRLEGKDQLGKEKEPLDGALSTNIVAWRDLSVGSGRRQAVYRMPGELSEGEIEDATFMDFGTSIALTPEVPVVAEGEVFDMQVWLRNPNHAEFDTVELFLAYNPRVLRPVDNDENNWIQGGINLHDGDSHETFPFDVQLENEILPRPGYILYRMKRTLDPMRTEGLIGTVRFKALRQTAGTRLKILFHKDGESPTTGLFRNGHDVLGWSDDLTDGVQFDRITIVGAEPSVVAAGQPASQ